VFWRGFDLIYVLKVSLCFWKDAAEGLCIVLIVCQIWVVSGLPSLKIHCALNLKTLHLNFVLC